MLPLEAESCWQPALWRAMLADVGAERLSDSRAGIHPQFVEQMLGADQRPAGLPRRVVVFGISSLPAQTLEALAVMGRFSQELLAVLNPCQYHWGDIVADQDLLRHQYRRQQRRPGVPLELDEALLHQHAHRCWRPGASRGVTISTCLTSMTSAPATKRGSPPSTAAGWICSSRPRVTACCSSCSRTSSNCVPWPRRGNAGRRCRRMMAHCVSRWPTAPSGRWRFCTTSCWTPSPGTRSCDPGT